MATKSFWLKFGGRANSYNLFGRNELNIQILVCLFVNVHWLIFFTGLSYGCSSCRPGSVQVESHLQALSGPLLSGIPLHHLSLCPHLLIHTLANWLTPSIKYLLGLT